MEKIDPGVMNYVNQSLFQEVLEHNIITTLFQNDQRLRSGKFGVPIQAENSIKLLLKSFNNLTKLKHDVKIVPVCINYDRIFEASYLANEAISGQFSNLNLSELMQNISGMRKSKLGKIFVKYSDPIDLHDYFSKNKGPDLALKLTHDLYHIH